MSTHDPVSKRFAKYCEDGKIHLVKKWFDKVPDVNFNSHRPMRMAIKGNHINIVKLLLTHPKIRTTHEKDTLRPRKGHKIMGDRTIKMTFTPFTDAMVYKRFEILDIFIKSDRYEIFKDIHADLLVEMKDEELTEYFLKIDGFTEYILELSETNEKYLEIIPDINDIFIF